MSVFEYLSVLVSIVLALGITHLISGLSAILRSERRVTLCALQLSWSLIVLAVQISVWWRYWELRTIERWGLFQFLSLLLLPVLLFLAARIIMPDVIRDDSYDLKAHYEQVRQEFFGTMFLALLASLFVRPLFFGDALVSVDHAPAALILLLIPIAGRSANRRLHGAIVAAVAVVWTLSVFFVWGDLTQAL